MMEVIEKRPASRPEWEHLEEWLRGQMQVYRVNYFGRCVNYSGRFDSFPI